MLVMQSLVNISGISGKDVFDFMLDCSDEDYQKWWPGVHLAFHTKKYRPGNQGNLVYFDEYIGKHRFSFHGILEEIVPDKKLVWRMLKLIKLPCWLSLDLEDTELGVRITHSLTVGFNNWGLGLDPFIKIFFSKQFKRELEEHAKIEFNKLAKMLSPMTKQLEVHNVKIN